MARRKPSTLKLIPEQLHVINRKATVNSGLASVGEQVFSEWVSQTIGKKTVSLAQFQFVPFARLTLKSRRAGNSHHPTRRQTWPCLDLVDKRRVIV